VLNPETAYDILKHAVLSYPRRDVPMQRDFTKLLLISIPSASACIHVLDGTLPVYSENDSLLVQQVGSASRINQILPTGKPLHPQPQIFGAEPAHGWCYYYQKAALARQTGDWTKVGNLYDETIQLHLKPADESELIPFFEGLVNLGRLDDARALYNKDIKGHTKMRLPLCIALAKDPGYPASFGYHYREISDILCK
jgi:hypothetical protein